MKNTLQKVTLFVLALALAAIFAVPTSFAQTRVSMTTLASALTATGQGSTTSVNLTSIAGITAGNTYLYVDGEFMAVNALPGANIVQVTRGYSGGGPATKHNSGALVFVGPSLAFQSFIKYGYCSSNDLLYAPWIDIKDERIEDCNNNQMVIGDGFGAQRSLVPLNLPPTGGTLQSALDTNGTAPGAATEQYCTELFLPYSKYLTGLGLLNGTTVGTDKHLVILYDQGGNLLANSAVAGALSATASVYQQYAFTTPFYAVGPAIYYGCFQSNGTTDTVRRVDTSVNQGLFAGKLTGETFGTIPNPITPPTTFTTALGPWLQVY
jgi:hypothetical protein